MPREERRIARADILDPAIYAKERADRRRAIMEVKRSRRVALGPDAHLYFESYETMFQQVLEMLHVEGGGEGQIADELAAYNPLIPQGRELVATLMFEVADPVERDRFLRRLGGVEERVYVFCGGSRIMAVPEREVERTDDEGKTSAVHFLHFPFGDEEVRFFLSMRGEVGVGVDHVGYRHEAAMSDGTRAVLSKDFG